MRRHRFDPVSFVFGAAFVAVSLTFAYGDFALTGMRLRWLGAGFLLALGVALLATSSRRARDRNR
jgi:hypothetical protein